MSTSREAPVADVTPEVDVLCVGEASWDLVTPFEKRFEDARSLHFDLGGGAVNVARILARAGLSVGLSAVVGEDALGAAAITVLERAKINVTDVVRSNARTDLVMIEARKDKRVVPIRASAAYGPMTLSARVVVVSGLGASDALEALRDQLRARRAAGATIFIDVNARRNQWIPSRGGLARVPALLEVVAAAHVVKVSDEDLRALGLASLDVHPEATRIVTRGPLGLDADGPWGQATIAVRAVDTPIAMGAGDALTASIARRLAQDPPADRSAWIATLRQATARARAVCSRRAKG
jgi:sugar/nucleoside kinase (ribokinase family)